MSASDGVSYYKKPEPREAVEQAIALKLCEETHDDWRLLDDVTQLARLMVMQGDVSKFLDAALAAGCLLPETLEQVGWYGPYGLIPGGMDNEPAPGWRPVFQGTQVGFLCHVCGLRAGTGAIEDHGEICSVAGARHPVFILKGANDA